MNTLKQFQEEGGKKLEEWKKEIGGIPENTCPDIDKLITEHTKLLEDLSYLDKNAHKYDNVEDLVKDFPSTWNDDVESLAEDLREDNEKLRELGKFWYEKTKEVLSQQTTLAYELGKKEILEMVNLAIEGVRIQADNERNWDKCDAIDLLKQNLLALNEE